MTKNSRKPAPGAALGPVADAASGAKMAAGSALEGAPEGASGSSPNAQRMLSVGVAGLGRAFTLMLPTFIADPRIKLVAATDPRAEACARFRHDFNAATYSSVEALCADPNVEVVYLATPHQHHAEQVRIAAAHGKHVLVEKPMAITLDQCRAMIDAARAANIHLIVGHSHSFDAPILRARAIIAGGALGAVRMINAQYYTDFLYRPRRPEELDTAQGGGVLFSQAAHQIDIVRLLAGGMAASVRAHSGAWHPARAAPGGAPADGAYSALIGFESGAFASVSYNGYGYYDSDELCESIGELGLTKDLSRYQSGRERLAAIDGADDGRGDGGGGVHGIAPSTAHGAAAEARAKAARNYGGAHYTPAAGVAPHHQHFGHLLVSCERGDIRPGPRSVTVYGDHERRVETLPAPLIPRVEVIDELHAAVIHGITPLHDGEWSMATLEVCLAMIESARGGREVTLRHQVPVPALQT